MTDRPILFSGPMIQALIAGRKTQTRRVLRLPKWASTDPSHIEFADTGEAEVICRDTGCLAALPLPYAVGDRLWVRETWAVGNIYDGVAPRKINPGGKPGWCGIRYAATDQRLGIHDRSSIHMPRWASRLTLVVSEVRAERLQDISEADAVAEGVEPIVDHGVGNEHLHSIAYQQLWDRLHRDGAWLANPWIAAISFKVFRRNVDDPDACTHCGALEMKRDGCGLTCRSCGQ